MVRAVLLAAIVGAEALPISKQTVTVGGFKTDDVQTATVFYPSDSSKTYPLLSFSHGENEGGSKTAESYKDLLEGLAAAGYVVIAPHSGDGYIEQLPCYDESRPEECYRNGFQLDQLRALVYVKETQEFAKRVDWGAKAGVIGHGIGADATGSNVGPPASETYGQHNIGAGFVIQACETSYDWSSVMPTFYAAGGLGQFPYPPFSDADGCSLYGTKGKYFNAYSPKVFMRMNDARYDDCMTGTNVKGDARPHSWTRHAQRWFDCHLKKSTADCDHVYNILEDCANAWPAGPNCDSERSCAGIECMVDDGTSKEVVL